MKTRTLLTIGCILALFAGCGELAAQATPPAGLAIRVNADQKLGVPGADQIYFEKAIAIDFADKLVKGAPYSAEAVTETVQALGDGNRITRKSTALVYRDSEGRTRREQSLEPIGPLADAGASHMTIFINDPVAGVSYILNPDERTAQKLSRSQTTMSHAEGMTVTVEANATMNHGVAIERVVTSHAASQPTTQSLGKRTIDGIEVEGTRSVTTIPAGEIGNERPIEIVSERWYSPQLQTLLLSTHNDPRFGETTYRLTNILQSDPARSLFEVPSDYTIKDGAKIEIKRKSTQQ